MAQSSNEVFLQFFAIFLVIITVQGRRFNGASSRDKQAFCSSGGVKHGVLTRGGFDKDYAVPMGVVKNIDTCVRHCCESKGCDIALMLRNHCYKLRCTAHPEKCDVVKSRKGEMWQSRLVRINREPSVNDIDGESLTLRTKSKNDELLCTHSPISTNVTLRGGVHAGNFSNLGEVESMHMCTALCCAQSTCDLAFMIGQTCVAVECESEETCQTVRARPTKFNPKISYVRRREINQSIKKAKIAQVQSTASSLAPSSTSQLRPIQFNKPATPARITYATNGTSCTVTKLLTNVTLRHGLDGENYKLLGKANNMEECIAMTCNNIGGNTAFLLAGRCYVVLCHRERICDTVPLKTNGMSSKMAYLQKPRSLLDYNGIDHKTALEMRRNLCSGKRIMLNHTIKGGIRAGNFTEISGIDSIENCTVMCCREKNCELAMLLNGVCFVGNCVKKDQCKIVRVAKKANFVSHLGFKIGLEELKEQENHATIAPSTHKIISYRLPQTTILKTSSCSAEKIFHNVTLIGGMKAANITSLGKASNIQECIGLSCDYGQGDLVLMLGRNCYTVKCVNERGCQTAPAQPSKFFSRVAYLKWGSTINETDLTLDQSEHKRYPRCSRSHILHNHTLKGGLRAGNFSVISQVDSIENCAAICCNEKDCDLALMLGEVCYIGDCANNDLCVPVPVYPSSNLSSQIAFIVNPRKPTESDITKDYSMIYILVGTLAMIISLAGLMWSVRLCMKRAYFKQEKDRLSIVDRDGDSLQDMQMHSPHQWSTKSGLHSLGGKYANNGPLFLSDSESEDENDFTALEEFKKQRAEHETKRTTETTSPNSYTEKSYLDMVNALNQKVRKDMQNL